MKTQNPAKQIVVAGLLAAALAPLAANAAEPLSPEDKALVDQATDYLQNLGEVKGRFVQTDFPQQRHPRRALSKTAGQGAAGL